MRRALILAALLATSPVGASERCQPVLDLQARTATADPQTKTPLANWLIASRAVAAFTPETRWRRLQPRSRTPEFFEPRSCPAAAR
jgi:hypothetical protein